MATGIDQQQRIPGRMEWRCQRQHHFGVATPTVHDDQSRLPLAGRDEPAMEFFVIRRWHRHRSPRQAIRAGGLDDTGRRQTAPNEQIQGRNTASQQHNAHQPEGAITHGCG